MDLEQLKFDCYNYIYSTPRKSATYVELVRNIEYLKKYEFNYDIIEDIKFNQDLIDIYEALTYANISYGSIKSFSSTGNTGLVGLINSVISNHHQLNDVIPNHNSFKESNDTDIYILSLEFFHRNWLRGVSYIEYKHHFINVIKVKVIDERLRSLYREITKENNLTDLHYFKIAGLDSMLGLLEYKELQHSLQESKEAKISARNANYLAIIGIFLSVLGLGISIYYSNEQIKLAKEQFGIEQKQYLKEHSTTKDSIPNNHKPLQFIKPK